MQSLTKNITVILGVVTLAFGAYYFYAQRGSVVQTNAADDEAIKSMLASTEIFISRSSELDQISFDVAIFEDARFTSLISFTKPVQDEPAGRPNPFAPIGNDTQ